MLTRYSKASGAKGGPAINAQPDQFLDWDKPLGKHSAPLQQELSRALKKVDWRDLEGEKGESADTLVRDWVKSNPQKAAQVIREAGIPGIKYLDRGSRTSGKGSYNYAVFDDKLIDILKKYGIAGLLGGMGAMGARHEQ